MRLPQFIATHLESILAEWDAFARSLLPGRTMTVTALRDDAESILRATARDMQEAQSLQQQANKSRGDGGAGGAASIRLDNASDLHGVGRVGSGFHITEMVSEYRALRASVLRLWRESRPQPDCNDIDDITRFNEALDQSLARGVSSYSKRIDESRQMFLAILSHDLRNPLSCIRMTAQSVALLSEEAATAEAMSAIERSADVMARLISDLIDFSSSGLGRLMPLNRGPVDLERLCREVIGSFRITHPGRDLRLNSDGAVNGVWDAGRMRQVVANLLGNALQHGATDAPITLSLTTRGSAAAGPGPEGSFVALSVHNSGEPIPADLLPTLFDPLVRYATQESAAQRNPGSIGLGLYIVREIVAAKGGTVTVTSSAEHGTVFTVYVPRFVSVDGDS